MMLQTQMARSVLQRLGRVAVTLMLLVAGIFAAPHAHAQAAEGSPAALPPDLHRLDALAPENLKKLRPKPPFDLTGDWLYDPRQNRDNGVFGYLPLPKLKPAAQASYDAAQAAMKAGKAYNNDEGDCFPAGMPELMTRVWPNETIQLPTMIYMVQMLKHEIRRIYLDGRPHADPEIEPPSYSGDSIGHFEGDMLVVDTTNFETKHHWVMTGIPAGPKLHIVEHIRLKDDGKTMEDTFIMTDPDNWYGDWVNTKRWHRDDYADSQEAYCLPDLNDNLLSTRPEDQAH